MLTYRGTLPRVLMRTYTRPRRPRRSGEARKGSRGEASKEIESDPPEARMGEIQMYLSDYRNVDGILLPHPITRSVNGEVTEEW